MSLPIPGGGGACRTIGVATGPRSLACCADDFGFVSVFAMVATT
jgi:hypothetical protein